ncbi:MAG: cytochrome d ubiquinol oxidase subunit II [Vulcanimicrobiaceae bacterium]
MTALAFVVVVLMLGIYVLLDGYDLGVGAIHLFVAREDSERSAAIASIGPVWNGNEVWLLAAGGTLFALFPQVYASAFSGFYLPFMVLLWLLMFRGIAIELRGHVPSDLWRDFFDVTFTVASILLILVLGVALGNVLRGVPLDAGHYFTGTFGFLLNPYALGVGLLALAALAQHGAAWIAMRVVGKPAERARTVVGRLWPIVFVLAGAVTAATFWVHSPLPNLRAMPWVALAPLLSFAGLLSIWYFRLRGNGRGLFGASNLFLGGMLASAAAGLYPYLLPGYPSPEDGLSALRAAPSPVTLGTVLAVVIAGLVAVGIYRTLIVRRLVAEPVSPAATRGHQ